MIRFHCPHCNKRFKADPKWAGRRARCPGCSAVIRVPEYSPDAFESRSENKDESHNTNTGIHGSTKRQERNAINDQIQKQAAVVTPPPLPKLPFAARAITKGSMSVVSPLLQPSLINQPSTAVRMPVGLVILMVITCLSILSSLVIFFVGVNTENSAAVIGGIICFPLYVAILIGLVNKQEWARVMLIWMTYCGIVGDLFRLFADADRLPGTVIPLFAFGIAIGIFTLILAHSTSVRSQTRNQSIAQAYIYHEQTEEKGEEIR